MHRFILGITEKHILVDHKDHNGLNNQLNNIRPCTHSQNMQNRVSSGGTSKYVGVCFLKKKNRWQSQLRCGAKKYNIGEFKTEEDAVKARDIKAKEIFGEFAFINIPQDIGM